MIQIITVHTTGVNWQAILTNVASIVIILGGFGAMLLRSFKRSVKDDIAAVIHKEVTPVLQRIEAELKEHDTRIARLEGVEEGKRQAVLAAGITTTDSK